MTTVVHDDAATMRVLPWPDEVIDKVGHDPRSPYVERFWLPILGPSSVVLLRRLAAELEACPDGVDLPVEVTARSVGLASRGGRTSTFARTLERCQQFKLVHLDDDGATLLVRRRLPPLNRGQQGRLPGPVRDEHDRWLRAQLVRVGRPGGEAA